jgi:hypothetical protein
MLDIVAVRPDHARDQNLVVRELDGFPRLPFMFVARVRAFDEQRHRLCSNSNREDPPAVHVVDVRALIIAPADMHPDAIRRNVRERMIESFHRRWRM